MKTKYVNGQVYTRYLHLLKGDNVCRIKILFYETHLQSISQTKTEIREAQTKLR